MNINTIKTLISPTSSPRPPNALYRINGVKPLNNGPAYIAFINKDGDAMLHTEYHLPVRTHDLEFIAPDIDVRHVLLSNNLSPPTPALHRRLMSITINGKYHYDLVGDKYNANYFMIINANEQPEKAADTSKWHHDANAQYNALKLKIAKDTVAIVVGGSILLAIAIPSSPSYALSFMSGGLINILYQQLLNSKIDVLTSPTSVKHSFIGRLTFIALASAIITHFSDLPVNETTIVLMLLGFTSGKIAIIKALSS
jgi:hypothetical protein